MREKVVFHVWEFRSYYAGLPLRARLMPSWLSWDDIVGLIDEAEAKK